MEEKDLSLKQKFTVTSSPKAIRVSEEQLTAGFAGGTQGLNIQDPNDPPPPPPLCACVPGVCFRSSETE